MFKAVGVLATIALFLILTGCGSSTSNRVVYNSIPSPLPDNVASEGPEAYGFSELGDGFTLAATRGTLTQVTVVLDSWACQNGAWYSGDCVTTPGTTFSQPITVNIYGVTQTNGVWAPSSTTPLASITKTFDIPYRPTSTPAQCGSDNQVWYSSKDQKCYHGIAMPVTVDFSSSQLPIPAPANIIVTVAYNTTSYGPSPIGPSATCYGTPAGCPYDSLNIATYGDGGLIGAVLDPNSIFVNYTIAANACNPSSTTTGVLALDAGCWTGYHPEITVRAVTP